MSQQNRLRLFREQKGWSQARLAREMGVPDRGMIGRWERSIHIPSGYYQEKLAQLLDVSRDELSFTFRTGNSQQSGYILDSIAP